MAQQFADESFTRLAETTDNPDADSHRLLVFFYLRPIQSEAKTKDAGRPIFEDTEYITIATPGDKDNIVDRKVHEHDRARFAQQYAKFKQKHETQVVGTPLTAWPPVSRSQVEELRYFNVQTVEQLAGMADEKVGQHMGLAILKRQARDFLDMAKGNSHLDKMRADIAQRDSEIDGLKAMLKDLSDKFEAMNKAKK